jgi:hypothetical protein
MPFLHRYLGNPVLTGILNLFFKAGISDAHCGMRAITREAYARLDLRATGMEFASEMVIKAARADLRIGEIPITLHPDRRTRAPHLRTWRDGWRHLRFMLLYSPTALFLVPGLALFLLGLGVLAVLYPAPLHIAGRMIDVHTMTLGGLCLLLGVQILSLGLFARVYAREHRFVREDRLLARLAPHASLERGVLVGLVIFGLGFLLDLDVALVWIRSGFGPLDALRNAILGGTLMAAGAQIVFASFFLSVLTLRASEDPAPSGEPD